MRRGRRQPPRPTWRATPPQAAAATTWRRRRPPSRRGAWVMQGSPGGTTAGETRDRVALRRATGPRSRPLGSGGLRLAAAATRKLAGREVDGAAADGHVRARLVGAIARFTAARIVGIFSAGSSSTASRSSSLRSRPSALRISSSRWSAASWRGDKARSLALGRKLFQLRGTNAHDRLTFLGRVTAMGGRIMTRIRALRPHVVGSPEGALRFASAQFHIRRRSDTSPASACTLQSGVPSAHAEPYPARVRRGVASTREVSA